jgi:GntR family transcriptional regulator
MLSFSQTLKAQGYMVETKVLMKEVLPAPFDVATRLQIDPNSPMIVVRRLRYVEAIPCAIHASYFDQRLFGRLLNINLEAESLLEIVQQTTGAKVAYSDDAVQADAATSEEASLFAVPPHSPVLRVQGVAYSENGQPTRYIRAVYRGDMFRLMVRNTAVMAASFQVTDPA